MEKINENITFEELLNQTLKEIKVGQTVTGTVIEITPKNEVFIDIGYKADGIIPANEYILNAGETVQEKFKLGDRVTAVIVKLNDGLGNVLLSYNRARREIDQKEFESKVNNNTIFKAIVSEVNEKGLITNFNTIKIFIPLSLSGINRNEDPHTYKGKEVKFKVIEYNPKTNRIIGSIKQIADEEKKAKLDEFWNNVEVGKMYTGTVTSLSEYVYATTADYIYNQVIELSKKRKLMELLQKSITELMEAENIDIFMQDKIKQINKIAEINEKEQTFVEQVVETSTEIEKNTLQKPDYTLYTGITDLDKMICGLHKQELTIIGARPGVGKTTLALQIAEHIAERGTETAIISLEMSDTQVIQKLISRRARINSYKMRMGTLETKELEQIGVVSAEIAELPIHLITKARTIQHIENIARKLKNKNNLGLMIID